MKTMNFKFLSLMFIMGLGLVSLSSCSKEDTVNDDSQLINSIQQASKQEVDSKDLPSAATDVLSFEYSDRYNAKTLMANGLGYEVHMANGDNPRTYVYFNLNGRSLGERPGDGTDPGDGDDRPGDGTDPGDGDDRPDEGEDPGDGDDRPDETNYDCPDLGANIGEECRDSDGNMGIVNSDCECSLE